MNFIVVALVILLVFYLYLLARWQYVRRPWLYLLGSAGLVFALIGSIFVVGSKGGYPVVTNIFQVIGAVIALKGAIGACCGAKLPICDSIIPPKTEGTGEKTETPITPTM
ncbi:MAG: hypothetical protein KAU28_02055 [Phycisphaerae bacterium]|nr:hypothetical protein [Phycisphaerae bacterium]